MKPIVPQSAAGADARSTGSSATAIESLACLVHSVAYADIPSEVVCRAKTLILDTLACAYGAVDSDAGRAVRRLADDCGGAPQATLIGTGGRTSAAFATLVNGTLLRYLDCNDYYFGRDPAHPSGNLAVALAVGERERCSGEELLAALVMAYEVQLRLCRYAGAPSLWRRGWHHSSNAAFSAAALASRLSRHEPLRTAHAMAVAGTHQNTLAQLQSGRISMIKATAEAWVAKAGVEAALLAGHGLTGPLELMEGAHGWAAGVAGEVDFQALAEPIAPGRYLLPEVSIKPYPIVATALAPVRAALELRRRSAPRPGDIDRMVVLLPGFALGTPSAHPDRRHPAGLESAQHSFYYCPAVALLEGACGEDQFAPQRLADPGLHALLEKVELAQDPSLDAQWPQAAGGGIRLHMRGGAVLEHHCPYPPGHPRCPVDNAELAEKFYRYAAPVLSRGRAQALHVAVGALEDCADLSDLARLLAPA